MTALQLGGLSGDQPVHATLPGVPELPPTHPVVVLETATSMLRDAVAIPDSLDAESVAAALADREVAIQSLSRALGPRPPRLIVQRLEQVIVEDRAIVSALHAHLEEVRLELAALARRKTAVAAYAAADKPRRR